MRYVAREEPAISFILELATVNLELKIQNMKFDLPCSNLVLKYAIIKNCKDALFTSSFPRITEYPETISQFNFAL